MKKVLLIFFSFILCFHAAQGQLVTYTFEGTAAPTTTATDAMASSVSRGTGSTSFISGCTSMAFNSSGWTTTASSADAISNMDYYEFTFTADAGGMGFALTGLSFDQQASGTGPTAFAVFVDGNEEATGSTTSASCSTVNPAFSINVTAGNTVTIRIAAFSASSSAGTWRIDNLSLNGAVLPIELSYFNAKLNDKVVVLNWRTETEENNAYMAIERSLNGENFTEIGQVKGAGTTVEPQEYKFIDEAPKAGMNYYRLRQVDADGTVNYHKVVAVSFDTKEVVVTAFPTVANELVNVQVSKVTPTDTRLQIMDLTGKLVVEQVLAAGVNQAEINIANFAAGHYFVRLAVGGEITTARFIKQ